MCRGGFILNGRASAAFFSYNSYVSNPWELLLSFPNTRAHMALGAGSLHPGSDVSLQYQSLRHPQL
jgi:hypothetical protein